jgi:flagellar biosynthesis protein FlhF
MELKRILARDSRTANEKAIALYGPDVLIISSCQVRGQTELIVAVDVEALPAEEAVNEQFEPSVLAPAAPIQVRKDTTARHTEVKTGGSSLAESFGAVLGQNLAQRKPRATATASPAHSQGVEAMPATPVASTATDHNPGQDQHDVIRGREIVDMVRDELAALRKEFRLSQQMALWSGGGSFAPAVQPLRQSLQEAPIPSALRVLLLDTLQQHESLETATADIRQQMVHAIQNAGCDAPTQGIHVVAGPSGSGKTLMLARLAQWACSTLNPEQVAVISYSDVRPGAWSQAQLLSAQSGVDCFRATSPAALQLLIEDLSARQLVLIDTAGVQIAERVQEIMGVCPQAQLHAVLNADASTTTIQRLFSLASVNWHSLMLSKLDESTQPWAMIQFLTEGRVGISAASRGDRMGDWQRQVQPQDLVDIALSHLLPSAAPMVPGDLQQAMARASARIAEMTS